MHAKYWLWTWVLGVLMAMAPRSAQAETPTAAELLTQADAHLYGKDVPRDPAAAFPLYAKACEAGLAEACGEQAIILWNGDGTVAKDEARAVEVMAGVLGQLESDCGQEGVRSCFLWGQALDEGIGTEEDNPRAAALFQQSCAQANADACVHAGWMYAHAEGVEKDFTRANELYQKACSGGSLTGCLNLASNYFSGEGVEKDVARGLSMMEQACTDGEVLACGNLGALYFFGEGGEKDVKRGLSLTLNLTVEGVEKDVARGLSLMEQACTDGEANACSNLGALYFFGEGVEKDVARGLSLLEQACTDGEAGACGIFGLAYFSGEGVEKDVERGLSLMEQACTSGHADACNLLGSLYYSGKGVEKDVERGIKHLNDACELGSADVCAGLADFYDKGQGVPVDHDRALALWERSCVLGNNTMGCMMVTQAYRFGQGIPEDPERAHSISLGACERGMANYCFILGEDYAKGRGVAENPTESKRFYALACDLGHKEGCDPGGALQRALSACEAGDPKQCDKASSELMLNWTKATPTERELALELKKKACDGSVAMACFELGFLYDGHGGRVKKDPKLSLAFYGRGCDLGWPLSCDKLGKGLVYAKGETQDVGRGIKTLTDSCENKSVDSSCYSLGRIYAKGEVVEKDLGRAAEFYERGCSLGDTKSCRRFALALVHASGIAVDVDRGLQILSEYCEAAKYPKRSCYSLGWIYDQGKVVGQDAAKAHTYFTKACEKGHKKACEAVKSP